VKIWVDAQLSPAIALWLTATQAVEAVPFATSAFETPKTPASSSPPGTKARS
jgi:predicted nuclease of predicted toxin-antitoxin system